LARASLAVMLFIVASRRIVRFFVRNFKQESRPNPP